MATLKDVAKAVGVSNMTVSRYFSEPEKLKKETRETIQKVVEELNYSPNSVAQSLVSKRTNIIYVHIAGDIGSLHPFLLKTVQGIGEALGEKGYSMLLRRSGYVNESCDGIIAMGTTLEEEKKLVKISRRKKVLLFGNNNLFGNWIDINNHLGSKMITDYVLDKGYKRIGYIAIDNQAQYSVDRLNGFMESMKEHKILVEEDLVKRVSNHEPDGYEAAGEILKAEQVDAIICASDILAMGVMRYATEHGIKVPEDLAVSGFDGLGFENMTFPILTTVEQPTYEAGRELAIRMIHMIENDVDTGEGSYIEPILKINGTV